MKQAYIVAAKRSAVGSFGGSLKGTPAADIAAAVIKETLVAGGIPPQEVDYCVLGHVLPAGCGMGPGRQAAVKAGIPEEKPAYTLNMLCSSGMKSVMTAGSSILAGEADIIVAGGMENMSRAPHTAPPTMRWGSKIGGFYLTDHMLTDGLTDVFNDYHMGITAENVAEKCAVDRAAQDEFALKSQQKAAAAIAEGRFSHEIVPVEVKHRRETFRLMRDEHPRSDVSMDSLTALKPAFRENGTVTAGNASGINDGAAIVVAASESAVDRLKLRPLAKIEAVGQAGIAPEIMGLGPVPAIADLCKRSGLNLKDFQLIELNEAFAAQALGVVKELARFWDVSQEWILERCNVSGGAIALGHPLGASGARIIVTLVHEMIRTDRERGLASLCAGGGMGTAIALKRV